MLNFIDIGRSQSDINLSAIPDLNGVIVGATFGCEGVDPYCDELFQQAKKLNLLRGVYHIRNNTNHTPQQEGDYFVDNITGYLDGNTVLVLDWEECDTSDVEWAYSWLTHVRDRTGVSPLIYMSEAVVQAHNWDKVAEEFSLWIAQYNYSTQVNGFQQWDATYHAHYPIGNGQTKEWPVVAMWQYASTDMLPGYNKFVDTDLFYGTADAWHRYASNKGQEKNPAPVTPVVIKPVVNKPVSPPTVTPAHSVPYTIQPEDSLTSIAQRHGTTVPAILSCNHIPNPNVIYAGTVIQIPSTARTVTGGSKGQWIVDPGNTMGYIANYYGVSVQSIVDANHSKYPQLTADYVQAGWVLNIP